MLQDGSIPGAGGDYMASRLSPAQEGIEKCSGEGTLTLTSMRSTDFRPVYGFRRPASLGRFAVWTIPSPWPGSDPGVRCCPSSLYTFPAGMCRPGLARDCHHRFPRI